LRQPHLSNEVRTVVLGKEIIDIINDRLAAPFERGNNERWQRSRELQKFTI
jgi:hypothetical protein